MDTIQQWAGPLPPPAALADFDRVAPGTSERIIAAWEDESAHRRKMEGRDLTWTIVDQIIGKVFAFVFVLAALILAAFAIWMKETTWGVLLSATTIAAVVTAFVQTNRSQPKK